MRRSRSCFLRRRRLTPPSSGRPKGRFAPFAPPLMSNVRPRLSQHGFEMHIRSSISGSRFRGTPGRYASQKHWRLLVKPRETIRGLIRGAAARETLLHPSPAKSAQRRIRRRLVAAYVRRFGADEFSIRFSSTRIAPRKRSHWLPGGYAWWRERALGASAKPANSPIASNEAHSAVA